MSSVETPHPKIRLNEADQEPVLSFRSSPVAGSETGPEPGPVAGSDDSPPYELPPSPQDSARLEEICQSMFDQDPGLQVLKLSEPLQGELDFHFLGDRTVREIELAEHGHVTRLTGLPATLQTLTCVHNELQELADLPASLTAIHVSHNHLSTLDFSQTSQLRVIRAEHNRLYSVDDLPSTLEELYVSHNRLSELNLIGLTQLRILHCEHNRHPLILKHVPSQPVQIVMDDGPLNQLQPETGETEPASQNKAPKIDYVQALNSYMAYKTKYETSARRWRLAKKGAGKKTKNPGHPPCVHCAANVGMTFSYKDQQYHAQCGATVSLKNCDFDIHLKAGAFVDFHSFLEEETAKYDQEKQAFMQQKMQTLFGYLPEKDSAELFKRRLEAYVEDAQFHDILVQDFTNMYHNPARQDLIDKELKRMAEIKADIATSLHNYRTDPTNRALLHAAVEEHVQSLVPVIQRLRSLKYPVMEMNTTLNQEGEPVCASLFQCGFDLERLTYTLQAPEVVTYQV